MRIPVNDGQEKIWKEVGLVDFNPLNPELNPICYLLALLGAHHFLHVSRIRVNLLHSSDPVELINAKYKY